MYPLAVMFPKVQRVQFPLSRDQVMLLMAAANLILLGLETYIAHLISGTIVPYEWIPITFGPIAGVILLIAGLIALRNRPLATILASFVFVASIVIGILGAYFHLARAMMPYALPGEQISVPLLVWAPPVLGPFTFALVGLLGLSAAWIEDPPDSGTLILLGDYRLRLPYSKTRAYFFITGMGALATVISSVLDHARTDFSNPWLWVPTAIGIFATVVATGMGFTGKPFRSDYFIYTTAMLLMILAGVLGTGLHILQDLTSLREVVLERFIRGAPLLAPLLFADIGTIGLIALLDPVERRDKEP